MRTPLRTAAIVACAVALVVTLQPLSAATTAPADDAPAGPAAPRRRAGALAPSVHVSHAEARRILAEVRAALHPSTASTRNEPGPAEDLTLLLRDLRRALPALTPSERAAATSLLDFVPPPSPTCTAGPHGFTSVVQTAHFCVHHDSATTDAWAQTTANTLDQVWAKEIGSLHFRAPVDDGDQRLDVYLGDLPSGLYGACAPYDYTRHSTASCVLDNDYEPAEFNGAAALDSLRVTAAHEYFHTIQFAYDTDEDVWFMEGTAVWAEQQVYPAINDYLQYLRFSAITRPRTPADYNGVSDSDVYFRYGAALFWMFLSERFGTPGIVRRVWELADPAVGSRYSLQAVARAVAERGWTFPQAFAQFGVWNTLPPASYDDAGLFPAPAWWRIARLGRKHRSTGARTVWLDHLTNAAMLVRPSARLPRRARLRIEVDAPRRSRMPRAVVQVRRRDGTVLLRPVSLDAAGNGTRVVRFNPRVVRSVIVTLTNASNRISSCGTDAEVRFSCAGWPVDEGLGFTVRARVRLP